MYVYACSNDSWWGNADPTAERGYWEFRGALISRGVIGDLGTEHPLSITDAKTVYLTGSNAGSDGIRKLLDVAVADLAPYGVEVHAMLEGRFYTELRPPGWDVWTDEVEPAREKYKLYDTAPPPGCFDDYGADSDQCYLLHAHYPYVQHPYLLMMPQRDNSFLRKFLQVPPPQDPEHPMVVAHVEALTTAVQALDPDVAFFVPDTSWHHYSMLSDDFASYTITDDFGTSYTMATALDAFASGKAVPRLIE